jgi:branched-chain amino acid transport system permease protein
LNAFLQALFSGLAIGGVYAMIAQGFHVTQITTNKINFGQGDFLMLGAMVALSFLTGQNIPFGITAGPMPMWVVVPLAMAVMALYGVITERLAIQSLKTNVSVAAIMSTVGVAIITRNLMMLQWGRNDQRFPSPFQGKVVKIGTIGIQQHEIFVFILSLVATGLLILFLQRSKLGKAMRAVAFNHDAASLMGISPKRMSALAFALSAALACLGGILVGPITFVGAFKGSIFGIKAFGAALLGGLDQPLGILAGGLFLGVTEMVVAQQISPQWGDASPFLLIIVVLAISPAGLFGRRLIEKV